MTPAKYVTIVATWRKSLGDADPIPRAVAKINEWRQPGPPLTDDEIEAEIYHDTISIAFDDNDPPLPEPRPNHWELEEDAINRASRDFGHIPEAYDPLHVVLGKLRDVRTRVAGKQYRARCPAHDDHDPSLSVRVNDEGAVRVKCWVSCTYEQILDAIGLEKRDMYPRTIWHVPDEPDPKAEAPAETGAQVQSDTERASMDWRSTMEIFAQLPETKWLVRGLHLGPGRPAMLAGYGASAKTLSAQALALAVASDTPVWDHFDTRGLRVVRHVDYEQGFHATARRYQRLALGHGIDRMSIGDRLQLAVFPSVYLDDAHAVDAYARACDGADLVIIDALRGATPKRDENDSGIRSCLDNLSRVSEKTGTAFLVLHHAGKPKDGHSDARTIARGSSAIFDACGLVLVVSAEKDEPRRVQQVKQPAEAEGGAIADFVLNVEDVEANGNPTEGVRVVYDAQNPTSPEARQKKSEAAFSALQEQLHKYIKEHPGQPKNAIAQASGVTKATALDALTALEANGRIKVSHEGKAHLCWAL